MKKNNINFYNDNYKINFEFALKFIENYKSQTSTKIIDSDYYNIQPWYYDKSVGVIRNQGNNFFSISGIKEYSGDRIVSQQPIILQNEIGFLGMILSNVDGITKFLIQAKIEPGNINIVQLSPTIQATKSNFMQKHGGKKPIYLEHFIQSQKHQVIFDQLQSEQGQKFYKKRNRNMIVFIDDFENISENHFWISLEEIKNLLKIDNIVNMDTRSLISLIPAKYFNNKFLNKYIFNSISQDDGEYIDFIIKLNNLKMKSTNESILCSLEEIQNWKISPNSIESVENENFRIVYKNIYIEGREKATWSQPLIESLQENHIKLLYKIKDNKLIFLCKFINEIGSFDYYELGPTTSTNINQVEKNSIYEILIEDNITKGEVMYQVKLSEEGGRFLNDVNLYSIIKIQNDIDVSSSPNFIWLNLKTLLDLLQVNNYVNIELRTLISLLEFNNEKI